VIRSSIECMNSLNSLNSLNRLDTVRGPAKAEAAERLRERVGALFGAAEPEQTAPDVGVPGVRVFPGGRVGRLREWLFVRCGLEFKTVLALAVVLVVAAGLAFHHYWVGRPRTVQVPPPAAAPLATPAAKPVPPAKVTVDIAGKVARPGLRRLPKGSRVADALTAAGGPLPGTDTTSLNLARLVADGEQILVGISPPPALTSAGPAGPAPGSPLSLNSATAAQLDALPGVGPVLAQHILEFRTQHGGFSSPLQLRQIPGIGPRKYATLQPLVHP
jgi:competence protein ComEA